VQLYHYFVSQSSEFCRHNPLSCFSTINTKDMRIFPYDSVRNRTLLFIYCSARNKQKSLCLGKYRRSPLTSFVDSLWNETQVNTEFLCISTKPWRGMENGRRAPCILKLGMFRPLYPLDRRLCESLSRSERGGEEKNLCPYREPNPPQAEVSHFILRPRIKVRIQRTGFTKD
jgi:hypothetical protein